MLRYFKEGLVYILKGCDVSKLALVEEQNSGRGFDNLQEDRRGVPGRPDNIVVQTHQGADNLCLDDYLVTNTTIFIP